MSERISSKTRLKIVNICLVLATAVCLAPAYWPSFAEASGYLVAVIGIVAGLAYFISAPELVTSREISAVALAPSVDHPPSRDANAVKEVVWEWSRQQNSLLAVEESVAAAKFALQAHLEALAMQNVNRLVQTSSKRNQVLSFSDSSWIVMDHIQAAARTTRAIEPLTVRFGKIALKVTAADKNVFFIAPDKVQAKQPRSEGSLFGSGRRVYH